MATPAAAPPAAGHRRNKSSTSVLKSIIAPKSHKRMLSEGLELKQDQLAHPPYMPASNFKTPLLPPDHPHSQLRAATRTENIPINPPSPRKAQDVKPARPKGLHKKTLSSVSLRTLTKQDDKPKEKSTDARRGQEEDGMSVKPKKTKSSTNLATMFGRGRSKENKLSPVKASKDQENRTPPSSSNAPAPPRTPIWAEFSSQEPLQEISTTSKVPLNDQRRSIEEEIARYTPQAYSPSKQRNFFEYGQPALQKRPAVKERPKSMVVPKSTSTTSLLETFSRKKSSERVPLSDTKGNEGRVKETTSSKMVPARPQLGRASTDISRRDDGARLPEPPAAAAKKPNRVMAAVAAFNGKSRQTDAPSSPTKLDPKVVDEEFEIVLVSIILGVRLYMLTHLGIAKHPNTSARSDANP